MVIAGIFVEVFKSENYNSEEEAYNGFCGVRSEFPSHYLARNDSINMETGKSLFRNLCAMCHNKTMTEDMTGPALEGALKRFDGDTLKFFRYVKNQEEYLQTEKDKRMIALNKEWWGMSKPTNEDLTLNELKSILLYIERRY
jgi:hypothetical protein